jgi:deoxyribose-phosphate aldolase
MEYNRLIDHTLLKTDASVEQIEKLCQEAMQYKFFSVCVNSCYVGLAKTLLDGSDVKVATTIGFPLGAMSTKAKTFEVEQALKDGADEFDMVINVGWLKSKFYRLVQQDIEDVVEAACGHTVKVIIETCYLTEDEKKIASSLAVAAGAHFVKTSTGFGSGGATVEDVKLIRSIVGPNVGVKASGGIRDAATLKAMVEAGANRIGASASVKIMEELAIE